MSTPSNLTIVIPSTTLWYLIASIPLFVALWLTPLSEFKQDHPAKKIEQRSGPTIVEQDRHTISRELRRTREVQIVENTRRAVVAVEVRSDGKFSSVGSGVLINARGFLLTNYHVVFHAEAIRVRTWDGHYYDASIEALSEANDIGLLRIVGARMRTFPALKLGDSGDLFAGETVLAIGSPFGFEHTVSRGVVSAARRDLDLGNGTRYDDFIQTDAAINPGNSGGALLNLAGELIGVNCAVLDKGWGISFAIPVDRIKDLLRGYVRREHAIGLETREQGGLLTVLSMVESGAAAKAGVQVGDVLLRGNNLPLSRESDIVVASLGSSSNDPLRLIVRRGLKELALEVAGLSVTWSKMGLHGISKSWRSKGGVERALEIVQLRPSGPAAKMGLLPGDLLLKIVVSDLENKSREYRIYSEEDLQALLERFPSNSLLFEFTRKGIAYQRTLEQ